jgi:hypothetical protein
MSADPCRGEFVRRQRTLCPALAALLVLWLGATCSPPGFADEILHFNYNVPGDSKAIVVHADFIATWLEGGQRIILLRGHVLVEHGVFAAHANDAALWVDQENFKRTGVLRVDLYCEGNITIENGSETRSGTLGLVNLNTRGEVKLRSHQARIAQEAHTEDVLYQRALQTRMGPAASAIQPVSQQSPAVRVARYPPPDPPTPSPSSAGTLWIANSGAQDPTPPASTQAPIGSTPLTQPAPLAPNPQPAQPPSGAVAPAPGPPRSLIVPTRDKTFRQIDIMGRTSAGWQEKSFPLQNNETATVFTGGLIIIVKTADQAGLVDIEADRVVMWTPGTPAEMAEKSRNPDNPAAKDVEFYLSGNVEIRDRNGPQAHIIRADEVYYNVSRHTAVALRADLEYRQRGIPDPIHMRGDEVNQLGEGLFHGTKVEIFSSRLPSDPGLKVYMADATLEQKDVPKRGLFGTPIYDRKTGEAEIEHQSIIDGRNVFIELEHVPIFYLPFIRGDANDPLGPLESLAFNYDRIFGFQFRSTWNMYDLLGIDPLPDSHWKLEADYLTQRGPALGQYFDYKSKTFFGCDAAVYGEVRAYGIYDTGTDILGGGRGPLDNHPFWRGRIRWDQNVQDLPEGFSIQSQVAPYSDKNFYEQYYKQEFDNDIDQETFLYVKQQQDNWAWTVLVDQRIRDWVTETSWLPRVDGYWLGQSIFDVFTYNVRASAGYSHLQPTSQPPPPQDFTDVETFTGRFDVAQELSLPFQLGPFKVVPYGVLDLTYYTNDIEGDDRGRYYVGGGARASIPFTRLYPDVQSDLLNLNGINHKIVFSANFFGANTNTPFSMLPQLDQLNDNASDQSIRDIRPLDPLYYPSNGLFLATSPLFNPQLYAIRTLVDNRVDTLATIEALQLDIRQRLQTKRGYPGLEHITDWMTLDLAATYYPNPNPDNLGESWGFLTYDYNWNVGDRTAIFSSGWYDPHDGGPRVFTIGSLLNRTDRTQLFLGYRQIDPLQSKAVTAAVNYIFSPKYSLTFSTTYDFGVNTQINSLALTRNGSDLQLSLGFTYNSILNTFGVTFIIVPNLVPMNQHIPGLASLGQSGPFGSH